MWLGILFYGIIFCLLGLWVVALIKSGHDRDEKTRREILLQRASDLYPLHDVCTALDKLYAQTLREIKAGIAKDDDTSELQDDLRIIINERNRILTEENEPATFL
jgi:hypothetical protein